MPIKADYRWVQKDSKLKLSIPLKGVSVSCVDIQVTASTLKVNFPPYLLDIILERKIDPIKHKANVKDGVLVVTLFKVSPETWHSFEFDGEKCNISEKKQEAISNQESLVKELLIKRKDRAIEESRYATRAQMTLDESERDRLQNLKVEEKQEAEKAVYETLNKLTTKQKESKNVTREINYIESSSKDFRKTEEITKTAVHFSCPNENVEDTNIAESELTLHESSICSKSLQNASNSKNTNLLGNAVRKADIHLNEDNLENVKYIPLPRCQDEQQGTVNINFTPRIFPTPLRESTTLDEEDWIAKNRQHLKKHGALGKNIRASDISQEDPTWLKAKGDDFFRLGDTRSALQAYCAALDIDETMTTCYLNRAACYIKDGMNIEAKVDCDKGIDLLNEELMAENIAQTIDTKNPMTGELCIDSGSIELKKKLVKAYVRRGVCQCNLGKFNDALTDYIHAKKKIEVLGSSQIGDIDMTMLNSDIERLERLSTAETLKRGADELFSTGLIDEAINKYSAALDISPVYVSCLSNRAACKITKKDFYGCVGDCTIAICLLQIDPTKEIYSRSMASMTAAMIPPAGSETRKSWLIKVLTRRGVALTKLNHIEEAILDFSQACALDPTNTEIKKDLNKLISSR